MWNEEHDIKCGAKNVRLDMNSKTWNVKCETWNMKLTMKWEMRPRLLHRGTSLRAMGILRGSWIQEITLCGLGEETWIFE